MIEQREFIQDVVITGPGGRVYLYVSIHPEYPEVLEDLSMIFEHHAKAMSSVIDVPQEASNDPNNR